MRIQTMETSCDLSGSAIMKARMMLSSLTDRYWLQVHTDSLASALRFVGDFTISHSVHIKVIPVPFGNPNAWALWDYENCVYSDGA